MTSVAVDVQHLSKRFRVPLDQGGTLHYRLSHPISSSRYRTLIALDDVTFSVGAGEFIGITGPNGCGKSTLLKILSGIYEPDSGRVDMVGRVSPFLELGVGFKYEMTARENIYLGGAVLGVTHSSLTKRIDAVLEFAELRDFAEQKLKNFSSGMVVRLAFAVAMLANAEILLMDEVLAVGDASFQERCFEVFAHYRREGRTIVLVSHDLQSLEAHCDRILLMERGAVVADGDPRDVIAKYRHPDDRMHPGRAVSDLADVPPERRRGNRDVEISRVQLIHPDGRLGAIFTSGGAMDIAIDYVAKKEVIELVCGISVRRGDGVLISGVNTLLAKQRLGGTSAGQRGTVTYSVPHLPLLGAGYWLSVALHDTHVQEFYDSVDDVLEFRVAEDRGWVGMVNLGGRWTHAVE